MDRGRRIVTVLCILGMSRALPAQELTVLDPSYVRYISQEISGDHAYEHMRYMTQFHRPGGGSDGLWHVAQYYEARARDYGLADVQLIKQASTSRPWNARFGDLWIVEPEPERLASTLQAALHLADRSRPTDVTAQLVDIGAGTAADLEGKDVAGKIVFTHGSLSRVMREAVGDRGALGVVWCPDPQRARYVSYPDQLYWSGVGDGDDGYEPTFAFILTLRQGLALRQRLEDATAPIRVRAIVDAEFSSVVGDDPWIVMVEGYIRGTEPNLGQDVVLTGHLQEEKFSANDNASGTASALEVARALSKLIGEGKLPRPRRNIRFWWVTEMVSQRRYFADHPDAHRQMWVNVNQDMVGANQAQDLMRVQNITRLPATHFHFLNDVVEAVVEYMTATNTGELAQAQAGTPRPYPRPVLARFGTRHRYNAKTLFFHLNTDHLTFNETPIRVPGVTFTNWPDYYIHTSDDDLWNIDATQLARNAVSVALIAYTMATAGSASVSTLASETVGRGAERLARNLRLGLTWIAQDADKGAAYRRAIDQIRYAAEREGLAITSLGSIHPDAGALLPDLRTGLAERERQAIQEIERAYRTVTGQARPPAIERLGVEQKLAGLRPVLIGGPREFLPLRRDVQRPGIEGLHYLMSFEILNAVDGERSGLDIHRYVAAEAREAGAHYYGIVTPEATLGYLEYVAGLGLIRLQ
jgi:hypothetical protein